jgi:DNA-binding GntR family transcriptional regulator
VARYQEVRKILADEIASGRYAVGARFPTDFELCERFGISRHSVREALRQLQDQGLLARRRGAGTVVRGQVPQTMFVQDINTLGGIFTRAGDTSFRKHAERRLVVRDEMASFLGCAPGSRWLCFSGVRHHKGRGIVLGWTEVYVAEAYAGVRARVGTDDTLVSDLIRQEYGVQIHEIEHEISALVIDPGRAALIGAEAGAPGLLVLRRYYSDDRALFQVSASLYPSDRYSYRSNLVRSGNAAIATARPADVDASVGKTNGLRPS